MDSLRIKDRRLWFRNSESTGGDAIAFLRHFHGMAFPEAVRYLLAFNGYPVDSPAPVPIRRTRPPPRWGRPAFVLPPPNGDDGRVRAYLRRRGIAPGVIDDFINMGLLYEDAKYHNCVFVGRDGTGKVVFAAKRGTYDCGGSFRQDVAGSNKRVAFRLPCNPALNRVAAFEAPIDLMSWFTLYGWANAIALCGLYEGPLDTYLQENPQIKYIFLMSGRGRPRTRGGGQAGGEVRSTGLCSFLQAPALRERLERVSSATGDIAVVPAGCAEGR